MQQLMPGGDGFRLVVLPAATRSWVARLNRAMTGMGVARGV